MSDDITYYHYTNANALFAIVTNKILWATDYRFLNDRKELSHALELFSLKCPAEYKDSFSLALSWYQDTNCSCVLSLSKSPKILSQWRAYANDAKGFAVGFSKSFLERTAGSLYDCVYSEHEPYIDAMLIKHGSLLVDTHNALQNLVAVNSFWDWVTNNKKRYDELFNDLLILKNPAFIEEQEVRAIKAIELTNTKRRVSNELIIPYYPIEFWNDADDALFSGLIIKEIWLGPKADSRNLYSLKRCVSTMTLLHHYDCGYV